MRFGLQMENTGLGPDPRAFADIAREAEAAGWDGMFVSDPGYPTNPEWERDMVDTWIALASMAEATQRLRIGTLLLPLPRYRPYDVALRCASLDHLSGGRLELTVGAGHGPAFRLIGEDTENRPARLRESLEIVTRLWTGDPVSFDGDHDRATDLVLRPASVQKPRIPVRVCAWNMGSSIDLGARYDGVHIPHYHPDESCEDKGCFERLTRVRERIGEAKELAVEGLMGKPETLPELCRAFADAGATWWLESVWWFQTFQPDIDALRARIRKGPPA